MTCKDCICYEILCLDTLQENELELCDYFKNKADFVEVVRCEKCIHSEDYNGRILCNKNAHIFDKNDFCSCGERRDT